MYTDVVILVPRRYNVDTVPYNAHVQTYTVADHNVEHVRDVSCCTGLSCGRRTEKNSDTHKEYWTSFSKTSFSRTHVYVTPYITVVSTLRRKYCNFHLET